MENNMEEPKINFNMTAIDAANILSNSNNDVAKIVLDLVRLSDEGIYYAVCLDHHKIYGEEILKLFSFCAKSNLDLMQSTLKVIDLKLFSQTEIHGNLSLEQPIAFIDDAVVKKYTQDESSKIPMSIIFSKEFQADAKSAFTEKLEKILPPAPVGTGSQPGEEE